MELPNNFWTEGEEGNVTLCTVDINGKRVELYAINSLAEAQQIAANLNAAIAELMALEAGE